VTVSVKGAPERAALGASVRMTGAGRIVSGEGELTVTPPTVSDIVPLVAFAGTFTTSVVVVAETTVRATPFTVTTSSEGVVLKPWPWMVMAVPVGAPSPG
jgi:hypothetical protein